MQWDGMIVTPDHDHSSDVVSGLLSLAHVMLSSGSLEDTLPMTIQFYTNTITILMVYSTEGMHVQTHDCQLLCGVKLK